MTPELERIESLKAGAIAALAAATVHLVGLLVRHPFPDLWIGGITDAIVLLSGGLFGVTYRYIVRQDSNPQLKAGAVFAFALVRGLSQIEPSLGDLTLWPAHLGLLVESLALFAVAQQILNAALQAGWVKPFEGESS